MHSNSFLSIGSWVAICLGVWVVAWVVAESIPVFNDLLSLIVSFEICTHDEAHRLMSDYRVRYLEVGSAVRLQPQSSPQPNSVLILILVGLPAIFWLYMNKGRYFQNWKKVVLTITNLGVLAIAIAIVGSTLLVNSNNTNFLQCGLGLYVSGVAIHNDSANQSWSCANDA